MLRASHAQEADGWARAQHELQRQVDEAEQKTHSALRKLVAVEEDSRSEISRLVAKNRDLEAAAMDLSSSLSDMRHKHLSAQAEAESASSALRHKGQQVTGLEEQMAAAEIRHARELQRFTERCADSDNRVDALIAEQSGLRRRCDELESSKRNSESHHLLDMQDLAAKLTAAVRDTENAHKEIDRLELQVCCISSSFMNLLKLDKISALKMHLSSYDPSARHPCSR